MPASYPASVKTFTKKRDLLDIVLAADINLVYDEVTAIEQKLGTYPATNTGWSGTFDQSTLVWPTVRERIQNVEYGLFEAYTDRVKSTGGSTLEPALTNVIGLTLKAKTGQTVDLFQARNQSNLPITTIDQNGVLKINGSDAVSLTGAQTLSNKSISGTNNSFSNIPTAAVVVSGDTDIREYVDARPTVYYTDVEPTGVIAGTIWVDSSDNVDPFDASGLLLRNDPSENIGTMGFRRINASQVAPTALDGADGDVWLQYV